MERFDFTHFNREGKPTIKGLADQICSLMPEDMLRSQDNEVFGRTVTFRDRFIIYCQFKLRRPKYTLEESKPIILKILKENIIYNEHGEIELTVFEEVLIDLLGWIKSDDEEEDLEV